MSNTTEQLVEAIILARKQNERIAAREARLAEAERRFAVERGTANDDLLTRAEIAEARLASELKTRTRILRRLRKCQSELAHARAALPSESKEDFLTHERRNLEGTHGP